ncbi:MAG: PilN domain-containing protein [Gemmatimonadales bacterium]
MAMFLALAAALWSVDLRRERTLAELERRIIQRRDQAAEVQVLLEEIADGWEELRTLAAVSSDRQNPLEVLLLVTHLLPTDAYLRSFSATGDSWELDGYARDAARLIPTLEESDVLQHVEFRSATTRVRLFNENYESFSLAFRYIPAPE